MIKKMLLISAFLLASVSVASAACTQEDIQGKLNEIATILQNATEVDEEKFTRVAEEMQKELPELSKSKDMNELCKFYDKMIIKLK